MIGYIVRRVLAAIPVMGFVALFVFLLLRLSPGDPAAIIAGDIATGEQLARIREAMGLDKPLVVQFGLWLERVVQGDFGQSLMSGLPVATLLAQRLEPTLALAILAMAFSVAVAVPLGTLAALNEGRLVDRLVSGSCVIGYSVPFFVVAYLLILLLALDLRLLPVQGYRSLGNGLAPFLLHLAMPILTLSLPIVALLARTVRASVLEVIGAEYVRTARAKGLPARQVVVHHILRNAAIPIVTVAGNLFVLLIGGVVVTESIFNLPGAGRLVVDAVLARDYPVIQGVVLITSFVYVLINLLIDLLYMVIDPRIEYQ